MSYLDIPYWWERAFPREHLALFRYAQDRREGWQKQLLEDLLGRPEQLPPELRLLGDRLGGRIVSADPQYREGDGVTIASYGSRSPGTVRYVVGKEVHVTSDFYVRVSGTERTLYVPSSRQSAVFVFTERKDHSFRLKSAKNTFLQFGRSQR